MSKCISSNCNSHDHTIGGHRCLRCGELGHDDLECSNMAALTILQDLKDIKTLDETDWCKIESCDFKHTHKTKDHTCHKCGLTHINEETLVEEDCIVKDEYASNIYTINISTAQIGFAGNMDLIKTFYEYTDNIYLICLDQNYKDLIIRKKNGVYNYLILGSDEANQLYTRFIFGLVYMHFNDYYQTYYNQTPENTVPFIQQPINYTTNTLSTTDVSNNIFEDLQVFDLIPSNLEQNIDSLLQDIIKCPMCRTENTISEIFSIKGTEDTCSVCYENKVDHFFSICGHACVCKSCFEQL